MNKMDNQKGKPISEDDLFYISWGYETLKNNIKLCNDILKQLITISSALLGISIIYEHIIVNEVLKILVFICFFNSLIVAFLGILPYKSIITTKAPAEIKTHKEKTLKSKLKHLWFSAISLMVGFLLIIISLILNKFI
jgi:hypothetical protein